MRCRNWLVEMISLIAILWVTPTAAIILILLLNRPRIAEYLNLISAIIVFGAAVTLLLISPARSLVLGGGYLVLAPLGNWVELCVALVYLLASLYAVGYMRLLRKEQPRLPLFYALMAGFALTMLVAPLMNNPGLYWIVIDLTTIVSAFLVGFEREPESVEAAWKYIVIVSAGLSLALLGIVIFYWGGTLHLGPVYAMTWGNLTASAPMMPKSLLLLAFLLVLVGFGTKVGLAPMHTWLPDAHSEGPAPVSAMLSAALLNTAMLGIVRFLGVLQAGGVGLLGRTALVVLGALSLFLAAFFIIRQTGAKRLMAYSSVEHMGIVALGFGFGGVLGVAGAMYHMLNHSLAKSHMFFGSGNMMRAYGSKDMSAMRSILSFYPISGFLWLLGAVAITGAPPFGLFLSEITIMRGGLQGPNAWAVWLMGLLLILIFIAFLNHFRAMAFGDEPESGAEPTLKLSLWNTLPLGLTLAAVLLLGFWWPSALWRFFATAAHRGLP